MSTAQPRPLRALEGVRILHVEDDPLVAALVAAMLDDAGADVRWVGRGAAALDCAAVETFDVFLLDLHLPDIRGDELGGYLLAAQPAAAVVVLTGTPHETNGTFRTVAKPFADRTLIAEVAASTERP